MRGLLLLVALTVVASTASAQENQGFVNPKLVTQNFVKNSLKKAEKPPVILVDPPANKMCAIPLLEVPLNPNIDKPMIINPGKNSGDEKMILPTIPVCGKN
jgi:hypothetical protein